VQPPTMPYPSSPSLGPPADGPNCTLRHCHRAPTVAVLAQVRSGAVHRVNIAFTPLFPAPLSPSNVSNTIVEKSTPIRPQESALYRHFCSPLSFAKVAALPRKGSPVTGFGWIIVRSTARSQSAGRIPFPAMSTSRSRGTLDWVRIWQKTFVCRGAYPQIRISYMTRPGCRKRQPALRIGGTVCPRNPL